MVQNRNEISLEIKEILDKIEIGPRITLENAKNGDITAKCECDNVKIYIHSRYNPVDEAEKTYGNREYINDNIFVAGFGMGYHIEVIRRKTQPHQKIFVWVTDLEMFKIAVENRDLKSILDDKRVNLIVDNDKKGVLNKIAALMEEIGTEDWDFVVHMPSLKSIPKVFFEITEMIERIEINKNSLKLFKPVIIENIIKNSDAFVNDCGIDELKNIYASRVFYLVAAGPSLDKNIDELEKVCNNGVIIAVGTVAKKLIVRNIRPDFIIIIDGLENIKKQMEGIEECGIPLIYFPTANHEAVSRYKGLRIVAFPDEDPIFARLNERYNKGSVQSGGSVATAACDCAVKLGAKKIVFVGQDLAISTDGYTHAAGTQFGGVKKENHGLKKVEGNIESYVYTMKNLYIYLKWFERYIEQHHEIEFINATEGGAAIKGAPAKKLCEVLPESNYENIDIKKIIENRKKENEKVYQINIEKEYIADIFK